MGVISDNADIWLEGLYGTLVLFVCGGLLALILGIIVGAMRVSPVPIARTMGTLYVNIIRNTPLTLVFFGFVFALPPLLQTRINPLILAISALGIYTATYVAETIRSGINTVPVGQAEAARAIGMTFGQVMSLVVMPQAFRSVIPPMMSVFIALLKNTTVAAGFSVINLGSVRNYLSERGENQMVVILWVMVVLRRPRAPALVGAAHAGEPMEGGAMTSVLYDVPGPRAIARNRVLGVVTVVVVAAIVGFFVWRLAVTGQFSAEKWAAFTYTNVWLQIGLATLRTLAAFAVAGVGALILGFALAIGRMSDHAWIRTPVTAIVEFLRAVPVLIFMFLLYYGLPVIGVKMAPVLGGRHRARALQRIGARRGHPGGRRVPAARAEGGRVRDRAPQVRASCDSCCCRRRSAPCSP